MTAKIVPLRPKPQPMPSREELVARAHAHAKGGKIGFDSPHVQLRMSQRGLTMRQVIEVAKSGHGVSGPTRDQWGDWRVKLRKVVAGRRVQIVVAVKQDETVVVTVI